MNAEEMGPKEKSISKKNIHTLNKKQQSQRTTKVNISSIFL